ncbi:ammonium transporter [Fructilactobacillus fructivorans]|uniref:Ammonium transporter n=1 Tax=Fructilactobacillus fructivorans TaxID=1614 RepID=A0A0C1PNZ6_9LACO|nr:ammonium transporter [Fructilactobacillus fructivorans]KID42487.1 Ammonium transporter [Fructilactobacillus fructivorans]MCT0151593.1 ammonium transporter [Fructilactobacillus fructivorans]MCT2868097.1 ammonium transporter [Fructilactobacillus fructivorans]MCT2868594.1 ammonium transporter [Fructilactobacillus fructivorans]MCT2873780.1 ammonium transporter [Fructilactobacillus fructivorans]
MAANEVFVFICTILVFFMTPGLAFFYAGMVSRKNVVNTLMSVFIMCSIPVLLWVIIGYSLSFSGNYFNIIGGLHDFMLHNFNFTAPATAGPISNGSYMLFQMMFAVITPALWIGGIVGRMKFKFLILFTIAWCILIYYPLVHIVWGGGFLQQMGVLDFAGGTVIHINAGITALVLAIMLGRHHRGKNDKAYNLTWVFLGTVILWLGWYGFNCGSALAINHIAFQAMLTTTIATATSMLTWIILDVFILGAPSLMGACTGTLCGLVAITPACGFVGIGSAIVIGIIATLCSYTFIKYLKPRLHVDDTLDAFGCHGISGIVGSLLTGLFASKAINPQVKFSGIFAGGSLHQFWIQLLATTFSIVFVAIMVFLIVLVLKHVTKMRVTPEEETRGLDLSEHKERIDCDVIND